MKIDERINVATAGIFYGSVTVGGSILSKTGLSTFDISFFFLAFSLVQLTPFVVKLEFLSRLSKSWKYLSIYALVNTGLILLQFESLKLGLPPAVSALLLYTQPIWTVLLGRAIFSERIDRTKIGIILLALAGVLLIADPIAVMHEVGSGTFYGELAALAGGVFLSLWIILGKKGRLESFKSAGEMTFAVRGSTCVFVGIISVATLLTGNQVFFESTRLISENFVSLFVFSLIAGTIPDYLFYSGIGKLQSLQAGVILLLEPVSSAILSVLLVISTLTLLQVIGGGLILFSNYLVSRSDRQA